MFKFKENIADYTENEFIEFLREFRKATRKNQSLKGKKLEIYIDGLNSCA
ncbi:bacteriocin immunity protein [Salmonella enterica]|nr:hypothetical protein [Salmonella enterica]QWN85648.1 bacteriocin immunity protein [Salmonella enterica]